MAFRKTFQVQDWLSGPWSGNSSIMRKSWKRALCVSNHAMMSSCSRARSYCSGSSFLISRMNSSPQSALKPNSRNISGRKESNSPTSLPGHNAVSTFALFPIPRMRMVFPASSGRLQESGSQPRKRPAKELSARSSGTSVCAGTRCSPTAAAPS